MTLPDGCGAAVWFGLSLTLGASLGFAEGARLSAGEGVGVEITLGVSAGVGCALCAGTVLFISRPVRSAETAAIAMSTSTSAMNMFILCLFIGHYSDLPACGK